MATPSVQVDKHGAWRIDHNISCYGYAVSASGQALPRPESVHLCPESLGNNLIAWLSPTWDATSCTVMSRNPHLLCNEKISLSCSEEANTCARRWIRSKTAHLISQRPISVLYFHRVPMRSVDYFNWSIPSSFTVAMRLAQPVTEMSIRNLPVA
jgi:hypothetical protein